MTSGSLCAFIFMSLKLLGQRFGFQSINKNSAVRIRLSMIQQRTNNAGAL